MNKQRRNKILKELINNRSQLLRIIHSSKDFQFSLSSLTWLCESWDPQEQYTRIELRKIKCFEAAMVVSFMRPFTSSRKGSVLKKKTLGIKYSNEENDIIKKIKKIRNEF